MNTTGYDQLFSFFGLRQNPFHVSPDPQFFFTTPAHESALAELLFAIETHQGLVLLTGEAGAGKTTLLQRLLDSLQQRGYSSSYVFHSRLDADELFQFILTDFGVTQVPRYKGGLLQTLHRWLLQRNAAGDTPVIVIDEAQALPAATLDELRLLLNLESSDGKLVQIVLAGQPELDEKLRRAELRQLRQRVMFRTRVPLLSAAETRAYIRSRLAIAGAAENNFFPPDAISAIYSYSKGIPRVINLLCEHAMIHAFAGESHGVSPEEIFGIASEFDLVENPLHVGREVGVPNSSRIVHFPLRSPEERSLSSLRMAFLSAQPADHAAPSGNCDGPPSGPALVLEQTLSLSEEIHRKSREEVRASSAAATVQASSLVGKFSDSKPETTQHARATVADSAKRAEIRALTSPGWRRMAGHSGFSLYWADVVHSFRRDARAFYFDCRRIWGG